MPVQCARYNICPSCLSRAVPGHQLKMEPFQGNPRSQWRFEGNTVRSATGEVLDIRGKSHSNDAELISYHPNGQTNQQWRLEFVDSF